MLDSNLIRINLFSNPVHLSDSRDADHAHEHSTKCGIKPIPVIFDIRITLYVTAQKMGMLFSTQTEKQRYLCYKGKNIFPYRYLAVDGEET